MLVAAGVDIQVCPGPSAVVAALMGAGLNNTRFAFLGFLPKKGGERQNRARAVLAAGLSLVIYEAPERIEKTLAELFECCGPLRVVVARELTKKFETFHRGVLGQELNPPVVSKGEMVVVVEAPTEQTMDWQLGLSEEEKNIEETARIQALASNRDLSVKEASKLLALQLGWSRKAAYAAILKERQALPLES